jgi:hypothetical protein
MSSSPVYPPPSDQVSGPRRPAERYDADDGAGWAMFAAIMLTIAGILNFVYGLAAVDSANFYADNAKYVISDLSTWGWILMGIGVVQLCGAIALFAGSAIGRWIGILAAGANAISQLLFIPSSPLLSIALFGLDVAIIFGLVAYGDRRAALR